VGAVGNAVSVARRDRETALRMHGRVVSVGSLAKGEALVMKGQCTLCHGPYLTGLAMHNRLLISVFTRRPEISGGLVILHIQKRTGSRLTPGSIKHPNSVVFGAGCRLSTKSDTRDNVRLHRILAHLPGQQGK
jgi:hypothetical protein